MNEQTLAGLNKQQLNDLLKIAAPIADMAQSNGWAELQKILKNEIDNHTPSIDRVTEGNAIEVASLAVYASALRWVLSTVEQQEKNVEFALRELAERGTD